MRHWVLILVAGLTCGSAAGLRAADVGLIKINGAIGPATASYIARAIDVAGERDDACLIIELDTPGGSLDSTKEIVQKFYASTVPTVVYVAPGRGLGRQRGLLHHAGGGRRRHGARHQHRRGASGFHRARAARRRPAT